LLKVGNKPIIEYNVDRLSKFGVHFINISIKYLGQQLIDYFGNGSDQGLEICYVKEDEPLGTIGALAQVPSIHNDYVLVMNSDLLTDIDYEDFYLDFINKDADMAIATIPYNVKIPYAVLELDDDRITSFREKPTYTYYSNGGIYIMKREIAEMVPKDSFYNATDLMEELIKQGKKVVQYPILGYWLDIGKPNDFEKAQDDIKHLKL
jgi:NDP-sugar pyrophosphorylase family protein